MANKNQELLDKLQGLKLDEDLTEARKQKAALDALIQAGDDKAFREAVREHYEALGLDDEDFIEEEHVDDDENLVAAGSADDGATAADNKIESLRKAAAAQRVMLELASLKVEELRAISAARTELELRQLLTANQAFSSLRLTANWADLLTPDALRAIHREAGTEATILTTANAIKTKVEKAEAANNKTKDDLDRAVGGLRGDATDGKALQQIHDDIKRMQQELEALQTFRASHAAFLDEDRHEDLKDEVDGKIRDIEAQLTAAKASIADKQAEILAFMTAQNAAITAKIDALRGTDTAPTAYKTAVDNRNGTPQQQQKYQDFVDLRHEVWNTYKRLKDALALDILAQPDADHAGLEAQVNVVKGQLKEIAQHGALPSVETITQRAADAAKYAQDQNVDLLNAEETNARLRQCKTAVEKLEKAMEHARFFHEQIAADPTYITEEATRTAFETKYAEAERAYRDAQEAYEGLQRRAMKKFGPLVEVTGGVMTEGVLLRDMHDNLGVFTDEVKKEDKFREDLPAALPPRSPGASRVSAATAAPAQVAFEGTRLREGEVIRSAATFSQSREPLRIGIIKQDHQGKVSDESEGRLKLEEKQLVAFKMAKMLLTNYQPGDGAIILRSDRRPPSAEDVQMGNMVYAALLLLKQSHASLKDIKIDSRIAGVTGPGRWTRNSTFITEHLGDTAPKAQQPSAITQDDREAAAKQLAGLREARYQQDTRSWLQKLRGTGQEKDISERDKFTEDADHKVTRTRPS